MEVETAAGFVAHNLLSAFRGDPETLSSALAKTLSKRYDGHWHPDQPERGSAFRCVSVQNGRLDPVLRDAAVMAGIKDIETMSRALPNDFSIWVDPGEVAVRIGDAGRIFTLDPSSTAQWSDSNSDSSEDDGIPQFGSSKVNKQLNPASKVFTMKPF